MAVALSPNGALAASAGMDRRIRLWEVDSGQLLSTLDGHGQPVWSLVFTPDGRRLLSAGSDEVVRVWDLASGQEIGRKGDSYGSHSALSSMAGEDQRGAKLFAKCVICHSVTPDGGNRAGPTLYGVFGRRAGAVEDYVYSSALNESSVVWTEATIDALFTEGPADYLPGTKMPLQRMPNAKDRADLIAYLKQLTAPANTKSR